MATIPQSRLEQVIERFEEVVALLCATTESDEIVALSREHAELKPVVDAARDLIAMREGLIEAEAMTKGERRAFFDVGFNIFTVDFGLPLVGR